METQALCLGKGWKKKKKNYFFSPFRKQRACSHVKSVLVLNRKIKQPLKMKRFRSRRITSSNQRLRSAGNNDRRSKRFCYNAVLWVSFTWKMVKTRVIGLRVRWSKHAWSNFVMCIPFVLSGSPNERCLHTCDACAKTTWRLGLRAPLDARN